MTVEQIKLAPLSGDTGDDGMAISAGTGQKLAVGGSGVPFGDVVAKTNNYTVLSADKGTVLTFNGSNKTATLPAAAPAEPWMVTILNLHATALTISPNGLDIQGGASSITIAQNQAVQVFSDGANYFVGGETPQAVVRVVSGTPEAGQVPVFTGTGSETAPGAGGGGGAVTQVLVLKKGYNNHGLPQDMAAFAAGGWTPQNATDIAGWGVLQQVGTDLVIDPGTGFVKSLAGGRYTAYAFVNLSSDTFASDSPWASLGIEATGGETQLNGPDVPFPLIMGTDPFTATPGDSHATATDGFPHLLSAGGLLNPNLFLPAYTGTLALQYIEFGVWGTAAS